MFLAFLYNLVCLLFYHQYLALSILSFIVNDFLSILLHNDESFLMFFE